MIWARVLVGALALAAATLSACSSEPVVGTVVDKKYDDPDPYLQPITVCNKSCTTTYIPQTDPEHYYLVVEDDASERHDVEVDPFTWDETEVGAHYEESER